MLARILEVRRTRRHHLLFVLLHHLIVLLLSLCFHRIDLIDVLFVNELALVSIGALSRSLLVPLLAHLGFVVLVEALWRWLEVEFAVSMRVGAILIELARPALHEVPAQLSLVIQLEVLNVSQLLLTRLKIHLLLFSWFFSRKIVLVGRSH